MMDPTDIEKRCMERVLKPLGEVVAEIGMDKPLSHYTRAQILTLIEVVVGNYQTYMAENKDTGIPF
ncbi:MAG: hypothetical protein IPI58_00580 [Alphaproteobacteria bacterium]|nr:MAG: hypothetical protein IPI58_00580 [Alphaproteobacteria bacterium]